MDALPPSPGRYPPTTARSLRLTEIFRQSGDRRPGRYGDPRLFPTIPSRSETLGELEQRLPVLGSGCRNDDRRGQTQVDETLHPLFVRMGDQALLPIQEVKDDEIDSDVGPGATATEARALLEI